MVKRKTNKPNRWVIFGIALLLWLAAYLMGSRALDTGSLQQYAMTFMLLGFAIRQIVHIFHKA